jgi:hypothetical protein
MIIQHESLNQTQRRKSWHVTKRSDTLRMTIFVHKRDFSDEVKRQRSEWLKKRTVSLPDWRKDGLCFSRIQLTSEVERCHVVLTRAKRSAALGSAFSLPWSVCILPISRSRSYANMLLVSLIYRALPVQTMCYTIPRLPVFQSRAGTMFSIAILSVSTTTCEDP